MTTPPSHLPHPESTQPTAPRASWAAQALTELRESGLMAWDAITAHTLRSVLTLLGVLVGVFSIIVVMTAIRVLQGNIEREMASLGTDTFQVQRWPAFWTDDPSGGFEKYLRRNRITFPNAEQLEARATLAKRVSAQTRAGFGEVRSRWATSNPDIELTGVTTGAFETRNWPIAAGRALSQHDVESARNVCVLGHSLARELFPHSGAIGDWIKFQGIGYTVIGVIESKGALFGQSQDNYVIIPITTAFDRFGRERSVTIQVQAWDQASLSDTMEQTRGILRAVRKVPPGAEDDFELFSNDSLINQFRGFTRAVRVGAAVISSIALLAAGIGIMNIMLVSVTERTREIGLRRAIGAKKRTILLQFVLEAIVLCQIGGVLGVLLGVIAGNATALFLQAPPSVPFDWVLVGLGLCSLVGILFGTYPAIKAANLDPIESLRYE